MRAGLLAAVLAALILSWVSDASAYTWMIRHGYAGCSTCHADPSGGELLTAYGRAQGDLLLRMRYGAATSSPGPSPPAQDADIDAFDEFEPSEAPRPQAAPPKEPEPSGPSPTAGLLWGLWEPPDWLLLGGSYRHAVLWDGASVRTFPMQLDVYGQVQLGRLRAGGSLGAARVPVGSPYARAAQVTANQGEQWNLISRSHWLGVDLGAGRQITLRAGRLNLPFGVRVPEHTLWARSATHTDRESAQQHGAAAAYQGEWLRGELMAIAGNYQIRPDRYRERGYSGFAEASVDDWISVGASSAFTVAEADRFTLVQARTARGAHGAFARARLGKPVVLLAEADLLDVGRRQLGYVGFAQLDLEALQGLHLGATGELLDQGYADASRDAGLGRSPGDGKPRFGGWATVTWFFLPHCDLRADLIAHQRSDPWLMAQLHVYL